MTLSTRRSRLAALAITAVAALGAACTPPPTDPGPPPSDAEYELVPLDSGTEGGAARAISPNGELIGGSTTSRVAGTPVTSGAVWDEHGHREDAAPLAGLSAGVNSIDDDGTAVGWTSTAVDSDWPTMPAELHHDHWHTIEGLDASTPFGWACSVRNDVVVGVGTDADENINVPWVHAHEATRALGSFGGETGMAYDVNAAGTVVGWSQLAGTPWRNEGFVVDHDDDLGAAVHIAGLGGATTFPRAINDEGVVAGDGADASGVTRGWIWDEDHGIEAVIDPEPGTGSLVVRGINDAGQVIGVGPTASDGWSAFVWDESAGKRLIEDVVDLPEGWRLRDLFDISDTGRLVGAATDAAGTSVPVLLRPIGEIADPHEDPTVVTDDAHLDVISVEGHDDHLHLGIDHANHPELLHPVDVVIELGEPNETTIGSQPEFAPLGPAGATIWTLDGGWSVHGVAPGTFVGNSLTITLHSVDGPGTLGVWRFGALGVPSFDFVSSSALPQSLDVAHNVHAHRNWSFTEPGEYQVEVEVSGVLAASGETVGTGIETYTFVVAEDDHDH